MSTVFAEINLVGVFEYKSFVEGMVGLCTVDKKRPVWTLD